MKKFALGFLVLGLAGFSDVGFAMSPMRVNARLKLERTPVGRIAGAPSSSLTVNQRGRVVQTTCRAVFPVACDTKLVAALDRNEMELIETLIDDARDGEIVRTFPRFHCMAMPIAKIKMTADNGNVFLFAGATPCPTHTSRNASPAAAKLIEKLNELSAKAAQAN